MEPPPLPEALPEDGDGLAQVAADMSRPEPERRRAFERLIPVIQWVARRLAVRFTGQQRDDVVSDAPGDVWEVIGQFPGVAQFEPWCYTVLRNRWFDKIRKERRRHDLDTTRPSPVTADRDIRMAVERAIDSSQPFAPDDLALIRAWPHRDRLVLLCLTGLWNKVPAEEWGRWLADHRTRHGVPAQGDFPPSALCRCDQIAERNALLAESLHLRRNTVSVLLYRGKDRLLELRYVRELLEPAGGAQP
jgi:DNA-directed RNA polymerase specialized sigma24 family protein